MTSWRATLGLGDFVPTPKIVLVLGGARSGKSRLAERLVADFAATSGVTPLYVATAEAGDEEMRERIAAHRDRRGGGWKTVEAPIDVDAALSGESAGPALVDCLTLWLSNLMHAGRDIDASTESLIQAARRRPAPTVFVSNEVGLGLVPETPLGREFRDAQGRLNQRIAAAADCVAFVAAGLPMILKAPVRRP